jgi:V/A-type H+-transporting ATPase subunit I
MIEPMVKYAFVVHHAEFSQFLTDLRQLGMVHIDGVRPEYSDGFQEALRVIKDLDETIKQLRRINKNDETIKPDFTSHEILFDSVKDLLQKRETLRAALIQNSKDRKIAEPWGYYDRQRLMALMQSGINFKFFSTTIKNYNPNWEDEYAITVIKRFDGVLWFAVCRDNEIPELEGADELSLPPYTLADIERVANETERLLNETELRLASISTVCVDELSLYKNQLMNELSFVKAFSASQKDIDGHLRLLIGWVPQKIEQKLVDFLNDKDVVVLKSEIPDENDRPPVLLRNNAFSRLFEPIGGLFSLPSYIEIDLTPFFAPFFMLFFGFCLGDAGYGLLMIVAALLLKHKLKPAFKPLAALAVWLGLATVLFGSLTGTLFGMKFTDFTFFEPVKEMLLDDKQMFNLALSFGVLQIVFGMFIKIANIIKNSTWKNALSSIGWVVVIVLNLVCFGVDKMSEGSHLMGSGLYWSVMAVCGLGIFIFNEPGRNVFVNIGAGIWDAYNVVTGFAGDVLSYIRLFALGMSGAILGMVFNQLALKMSPDIIVVHEIVVAMILIVGHSLNIFMSILGSFVHPMRLTFVEFYKNAGFAGGGKAYSPFKNV